MGKRERERERERERKGWRGLLYPLTQKRAVTALRPGMSVENSETSESPETPGKPQILTPDTPAFQGQHPRKYRRERVGAKVSLIGFVMATRALVRLLEDTFPVPLYSMAFLGLKFKI
jgi:hypothetical protein